METAVAARRDVHVFALDETDAWNLPEWAEHIERVESIYAFDRTEGFHLAEFTRSYELWLVDQRAVLKEGTPEDIAAKIDDVIASHVSWSEDGVIYMHAYEVDSIIERLKASGEPWVYRHMGEDDPGQSMEDIAQSFRENVVL